MKRNIELQIRQIPMTNIYWADANYTIFHGDNEKAKISWSNEFGTIETFHETDLVAFIPETSPYHTKSSVMITCEIGGESESAHIEGLNYANMPDEVISYFKNSLDSKSKKQQTKSVPI